MKMEEPEMETENAKQTEERAVGTIEDLTENETDAGKVKGVAVDMFLKITDVKVESKEIR